jgi:hypothetical protein
MGGAQISCEKFSLSQRLRHLILPDGPSINNVSRIRLDPPGPVWQTSPAQRKIGLPANLTAQLDKDV